MEENEFIERTRNILDRIEVLRQQLREHEDMLQNNYDELLRLRILNITAASETRGSLLLTLFERILKEDSIKPR